MRGKGAGGPSGKGRGEVVVRGGGVVVRGGILGCHS